MEDGSIILPGTTRFMTHKKGYHYFLLIGPRTDGVWDRSFISILVSLSDYPLFVTLKG